MAKSIVDQYLSHFSPSSGSSRARSPGVRRGRRLGLPALGLLAVSGLIAWSFVTNPYVPAGHEGYIFERPRLLGTGGFKGEVKGPGNYGFSLLRNEAIVLDVRPRTYTEPFNILAQDDLNIGFEFHAVFEIEPDNVERIVNEFGGEQWYQRIVQKPFRTFIRESVQQYNSREIKVNRETIARNVGAKLESFLKDSPFTVVSMVVGNIDYPSIVARAVENKLAASQLLEEKEIQQAIARKDAQIRIEEARGIAEAQRIINTTLTANYLQHEAINAQLEMASSPNHTTVYIPVGTNGIPLIRNAE